MKIKGYIIHLLRSEGRKPAVEAIIRDASVPCAVMPAVDARALPHDDVWGDYRRHTLDPRYPFELGAGECGCLLSHRTIWREVVAEGLDTALIYEDDTTLDPSIHDGAMRLALAHIDTYGIIQLQPRVISDVGPALHTEGPHTLHLPELAALRSNCTLVSGWAAAKLAKASETFDRPLDVFLQTAWGTGVRPALIQPSGVTETSALLGGTTIQNKRQPLGAKLVREIKRPLFRSKMRSYARRHAAKS